ncbi:hypothetical protein phiRKBJ001_92 [Streptomyces phage phiRKBJ001]|nr:hypothetical protein phiRKBJ001_92 [Streptomyces phage phiRKBJ001]
MDEFKAELDAKSADEVREEVIFIVMMANMMDREDATYLVDEMVAGDMSADDFGPHARYAIERIARG